MEIPNVKTAKSLTSQMLAFSAYTIKLVDSNRFSEALKCITDIEVLWQTSGQNIRNIIDNLFIYSVSSHMEASGELEIYLNPIVSPNLYKAYQRQVNSSGV